MSILEWSDEQMNTEQVGRWANESWVSGSVIVSDLEIAIASPSFANLFLSLAFACDEQILCLFPPKAQHLWEWVRWCLKRFLKAFEGEKKGCGGKRAEIPSRLTVHTPSTGAAAPVSLSSRDCDCVDQSQILQLLSLYMADHDPRTTNIFSFNHSETKRLTCQWNGRCSDWKG